MTLSKKITSFFVSSLLLALTARAEEFTGSQRAFINTTQQNAANLPNINLYFEYEMTMLVALNTTTHADVQPAATSLPSQLNLGLSYQLDEDPLAPNAPVPQKLANFALPSRAEEEIARIEARRDPRIEVGFEVRDRSANEGTSSYHGQEIPMAAWWPFGYEGHSFVQVDYVNIDAGNLPNNNDAYNFGKLAAKQFIPVNPVSQKAEGASVSAGYAGDDLRWDVGIVGIGFPVTNFVGGIRKSFELGKIDYAIELSRRPQTGSLLSYAGARDAATGEVWGGVTNTAINGRVSKTLGEVYTFASAEYGVLQGENVLNNNRLALRAGVDKDFLHQPDMRLNLGLILSYWQFKENPSNYTFGHGGYYSPQEYTAISLPIEWTGRKNKLSYLMRGSISLSRSQEKAMDYYPTDSALQNSSDPDFRVYKGSSGGGFGYALRLTSEYQATPHLAVGGRLDIERSNYYEPNTFLVYLRYNFLQHQELDSYPPKVVKPISQF